MARRFCGRWWASVLGEPPATRRIANYEKRLVRSLAPPSSENKISKIEGVILAGGVCEHSHALGRCGWRKKLTGRISTALFVAESYSASPKSRAPILFAVFHRRRWRTIDRIRLSAGRKLDRRAAQHRLHFDCPNTIRARLPAKPRCRCFGLTGNSLSPRALRSPDAGSEKLSGPCAIINQKSSGAADPTSSAPLPWKRPQHIFGLDDIAEVGVRGHDTRTFSFSETHNPIRTLSTSAALTRRASPATLAPTMPTGF